MSLAPDCLSSRDVFQPTLEHIDAEVLRILDNLASALVNHETLQGTELEAALRGVKPYFQLAKATSSGSPSRGRKADPAV